MTDRTQEREVLGAALARMLDLSRTLPPERLADLALTGARDCGATRARVWLADVGARRLIPLHEGPHVRMVDIDTTVAGRAYFLSESVEVPNGDGVVVWVPLLDGVDRIGVVQFEVDWLDQRRRNHLSHVAAVVASEVIARGQYSDVIALARRERAMTFPAEIQWQLLRPGTFSTGDVSVAATLEPCYEIAGDAYDYAYNEGTLHAAVFDAIGHDIKATIVCGLAVGAYRHARRCGEGLEEIVTAIDSVLSEQFPDEKFVTALIATLDAATGRLSLINAGHPEPILIREDRVVGPLASEPWPPLGLAGIVPMGKLSVTEIALQPGDRVLIYTDGIVEARTAKGEDFGLARLHDFVQRALASGTADSEILRRLIHAVVDHHAGALRDDASAVLVHWHPQR